MVTPPWGSGQAALAFAFDLQAPLDVAPDLLGELVDVDGLGRFARGGPGGCRGGGGSLGGGGGLAFGLVLQARDQPAGGAEGERRRGRGRELVEPRSLGSGCAGL